MALHLSSSAKTDVGLKRTNNEDNFIMLPNQGIYILADGMGGHASGQVASALAVTHVTEFLCVNAKQANFQLPYPVNPALSHEAALLTCAIKFANERVYIQSCKDRSMEGMGTTITAIYVYADKLILAHVGDSRIYRVRDGKITQLSRDHSLLNHLIANGEINAEQARNFGSKNVILRALGLKDYVDVDIREEEGVKGDVYLMCSDGLSDLVSDDEIEETIVKQSNLTETCASLIRQALDRGGKDNVTVVCVSVDDIDENIDERSNANRAAPRVLPAENEKSLQGSRSGADHSVDFKSTDNAALKVRTFGATNTGERLHSVRELPRDS